MNTETIKAAPVIGRRTREISKNRAKLVSKCLAILNTSIGRIQKQGGGCSIDGIGAVYKNGTQRDAIAILLAPSAIKNHTYGEISEEDQGYIVKQICNLYSIQYAMIPDREFLIKFLQQLQDAHDNAFDCFNPVDGDRMQFFLNECNKIKESLQNAK